MKVILQTVIYSSDKRGIQNFNKHVGRGVIHVGRKFGKPKFLHSQTVYSILIAIINIL